MTNNEPAFPQTIDDAGTIRSANRGLTKLEHFAGLAMQALLVKYGDGASIAFMAYGQAQAMLAESERIQNENKD